MTGRGNARDNEKVAPECDEEDRNALRLLLQSIGQSAPESWSVDYREVEDLLDTQYR